MKINKQKLRPSGSLQVDILQPLELRIKLGGTPYL